MANNETTTGIVYPSLDAYDQACGCAGPKSVEDPHARFYDERGWWTTGAVRIEKVGAKPLPVTVEVKDAPSAKKLARAGGRPLKDADARLKQMIADFYQDADEVPDVIHKAFGLKGKKSHPAAPEAAKEPAKPEAPAQAAPAAEKPKK